MGLTKVTSAFGDILSYLRLFALGLASALVVALAAMALFAALDTLFGVDVSGRIFSDVWE